MERQNPLVRCFIMFVLGCALVLVSTNVVFAEITDLRLPVPMVMQHLKTPDTNGDTGLYDCSAATLTMVLQTLTQAQKIEPGITDYATIRRTLRSYSTNIYEGIDLRDVVTTTPAFTNSAVTAEIFHTSSTDWQTVIKDTMQNGVPVIVYLSDWRYLPNHATKRVAPHAIVISGITATRVQYHDSWDGGVYEVPKDMFERAWAAGPDSFYGVRFTIVRPSDKKDNGPFMQIFNTIDPHS